MKKPCFVQDYLRDILEAMDKAEEFTNGLDLPMFTGDDKTSFAVIRCLEIIVRSHKGTPAMQKSYNQVRKLNGH